MEAKDGLGSELGVRGSQNRGILMKDEQIGKVQ
jgi:hypothetical protein